MRAGGQNACMQLCSCLWWPPRRMHACRVVSTTGAWILRDPINPMRTGGQDACMQLNSCIWRRPEMHTCMRGCKHNGRHDPEGMGRATPSTQWELCRTQRLQAAALLPPVAGRDAGMHAGLQHHRECELPGSTSNGVQEPACNEEVCTQTSTPPRSLCTPLCRRSGQTRCSAESRGGPHSKQASTHACVPVGGPQRGRIA